MKRDTSTADSETDTTRKGSVLPLTGKSKPNNLKQLESFQCQQDILPHGMAIPSVLFNQCS